MQHNSCSIRIFFPWIFVLTKSLKYFTIQLLSIVFFNKLNILSSWSFSKLTFSLTRKREFPVGFYPFFESTCQNYKEKLPINIHLDTPWWHRERTHSCWSVTTFHHPRHFTTFNDPNNQHPTFPWSYRFTYSSVQSSGSTP